MDGYRHLEQAFDYYDAVTKEDVTKADGVKRASERVQRLMRAYARHQGTQASIATLKEDLKNNDTTTLDDDTINGSPILQYPKINRQAS